VSATPATVTAIVALSRVVPASVDVSVAWQEPVPPVVVQLVGPLKSPGPLRKKTIVVPSGALA
jgi:hypothetical protein